MLYAYVQFLYAIHDNGLTCNSQIFIMECKIHCAFYLFSWGMQKKCSYQQFFTEYQWSLGPWFLHWLNTQQSSIVLPPSSVQQ